MCRVRHKEGFQGSAKRLLTSSFIDGRDAILLADQALTGGANQCSIWKGFAKRGLGMSAKQGSSASVTDGTQSLDVPAACQGASAWIRRA